MFLARFGPALLCLSVAASGAASPKPVIRPDLADLSQGHYEGDVISDARGSSRSGVDVTITKIGKNTISVKADYRRIPPRTFQLTKVMDTVQNLGGSEVFLLELKKSPRQLSLTIDDASWSGQWVSPLAPAKPQ
jgi:hypothetical protein